MVCLFQPRLARNRFRSGTRAAVELGARNPSRAIARLEAVRRYELATPRLPDTDPLYPAYLRGMAYLAVGSPEQARTEFQKILDHPGLIGNGLIGALAHLGMGRAYAAKAATGTPVHTTNSRPDDHQVSRRTDALAKSQAAYKDFFAIWKDADPNIPLLIDARKESRKLQRQ